MSGGSALPSEALSGTALATRMTGGPYDTDRLLAGYRTAWAQEPLFDVRGRSGSAAYDEFVDAAGNVRPGWRELAEIVGERGRDGLDRLRTTVGALVENDGITYIAIDQRDRTTKRRGCAARNGHATGGPTPWQLDALPLLVTAEDWATLESGLVQRSRLLAAVLADLYGPRRCVTEGVLPPRLLFAHPGYIRAANAIEIPSQYQLFMHGCDISRDPARGFVVNADWTQAPSGAGYALADRRVVAHAAPDLYERIGPRPASPFAQTLRLALIDAAPEGAEDPTVVVLTPGIHSETAFDQAYLASVLGFPLVESADLVVRDGKLWMRSLGALNRVDVVLRRVDADFVDPLDLRPDSRLGVVGLVEVLRRGAVSVVNTLGSGILESPGLMRFLPELSQQLLGENPLLPTASLYWAGIDAERSHLLANLSSLLIKSTTGGQPIVGPALSAKQRRLLAARIRATPWQWVGQELPQFSSAPTDHYPGGLAAANVGMRLFTVSQRGGYAPMIGGLGYVLAPGNIAYRLNTIAAKDIWVQPPVRAQAEVTVSPVEQPIRVKAGGTRGISSPRVLSDLFWVGRYAERAEGMARLLTVARERYHEYHLRQDTDESECVPVLFGALGQITGTDSTVADAQAALWSLTADRECPGSLAQSVEGLGLAARAVRDQMSKDTWMVLGGVERMLAQLPEPVEPGEAGASADDTQLAAVHAMTLAGMLAMSGVAAESVVRDVDWTMADIGKRIERGLWLTALLGATLTEDRSPDAEQTIIESTLVVCESSVIYLRRYPGMASVATVAELLLFEAENPRSLAYQLERLRANLRALPGASGSSRAERLADEIGTRLRRIEPSRLDRVAADGQRAELAGLLSGMHAELLELADVITSTQLSLPGEMQPLWGPDLRRVVP
jgi:uncharacterized circularly permuted ATP-grasp superfamily protein/uncharacterized alpha-E superfamily protein